MATEGDTAKEMKAHLGTYAAFTGLMKWGAIVSLLTALLVILIIYN